MPASRWISKLQWYIWEDFCLITEGGGSIILKSLYSIDTYAILNYSLFVRYSTYILIEQLHYHKCDQKPCATPFLFLYSRSPILHSRTMQSSALIIVRFSHQFRPRVDSIHTSNSTNALFQANLLVITPGYTPKDLQVNVTK
jgi:hypothetical protein